MYVPARCVYLNKLPGCLFNFRAFFLGGRGYSRWALIKFLSFSVTHFQQDSFLSTKQRRKNAALASHRVLREGGRGGGGVRMGALIRINKVLRKF